jgi:hypothetical protein
MLVTISQILISKPIIHAVKVIQPAFNASQYGLKLDRTAAPLPLSRIETYRASGVNDITDQEPISVSFVTEQYGKQYYRIIDGRHRYAQVLALGRSTINVLVV